MHYSLVGSTHTVDELVNHVVSPSTPLALKISFLPGHPHELWSLLVPMARAHRGGLRSWTRAAVLPVEGVDFNDFETASGVGGVLALATVGGETAELFTNFCRRNLTMESWDFIKAALHYETTVSAEPTGISWDFHRDVIGESSSPFLYALWHGQ